MLSADQRRRHGRHLLLVEIGEAGQARLCASRVAAASDSERECRGVAQDYVSRAGMTVAEAGSDAEAMALPTTAALHVLAGRAELHHAAAALAGAFAAVEAIKRVVGAGEPARLPADLCLDGGER